MAETEGDNALLARGGGGLPGPVLVNPLAAISSGINVAEGEYRVRGQQANEAAGQAYQGAINPQTGEFDPNEFRRRLAASGPAAMAAGAALLNTQQISSNQFDQDRAKAQWASSRAATLTRLGPNITEQHALDVLQEGLRTHVLTQPEFDRQSAEVRSLGGDPAKLNAWANQHEFNAMSIEQQIQQKYGTREPVQAGDTTYHPVIPPARQGGTVTTKAGPAPGDTVESYEPFDSQGQIPRDANGQFTRPPNGPVTWNKLTVPKTAVPGVSGSTPPAFTPPAAQPPIPPPPGTSLKGGYQPRPTTPGPQSQNVPPGASEVPSFVAAIAGGMQQARAARGLEGGVMTAGPGAPTSPAPAPGVKPPLMAAPPQGQPEVVGDDVKQYQAGNAAMPDARKSLIAGETALQALDLTRSGPGTATMQRIRAFFVAQGLPVPWTGDDTKTENYDLARKSLLRFAQANGGKVGTDLGLATQIDSNANVEHMVQSASRHVLIQDLGIARQRIAQQLEAPQGPGFGKHIQTFTGDTDPRGFAWDLYSPPQRAAIEAEAKKTKGGMERLDKAIEIADKHHLIATPNAPPAQPPPPAVVAPVRPVAPPPPPVVVPPPVAPSNALLAPRA